MSFWHQSTMQPKRNYRFQVIISNLSEANDADGSQSIIWWAKNFKPPSYTISEATHEYMDNKYFWPGRVTWEECTMQLVDPVSPNAAGLTNAIIQKSGYVVKTNADDGPGGTEPNQLQTIGKINAVEAMGNVTINILSADGQPIESWVLKNPFIKSVSYSNLDYTSDDLRTIDIGFKYDYAICNNYSQDAAGNFAQHSEDIMADQFFAGENHTVKP